MRRQSNRRPIANSICWIVVANRSEAVVFEDEPKADYRFVHRLTNSLGSAHESELVSDQAGSAHSSTRGLMVAHSLNRRNLRHEHIAQKFAKQISQSLKLANSQRKFQKLVVVAEPHFLGLLREALPSSLQKTIDREIGLELTGRPGSEIKSQITAAS